MPIQWGAPFPYISIYLVLFRNQNNKTIDKTNGKENAFYLIGAVCTFNPNQYLFIFCYELVHFFNQSAVTNRFESKKEIRKYAFKDSKYGTQGEELCYRKYENGKRKVMKTTLEINLSSQFKNTYV